MVGLWFSLVLVIGSLVGGLHASAGDADPIYRACVGECEKTGHVGDITIPHCLIWHSDQMKNSSWYMQEPLYLQWKQLNCGSDCCYHCMLQRENERQELGLAPIKYHGKWPFKRIYVFQEPASAAFSALNLVMHFNGWLSFFILVNYKLPLRPQSKRTYYEYTGLWHIYGFLAMNAWLWSALFHTRDFELIEKFDYSSAVALLGFSLILSLLRAFDIKDEATRVMYAAPILAFVTTHILYLNFYELDFGWNMKVCTVMGVAQLLSWAIWAGRTPQPHRLKIWAIVLGGAVAMLLETYDFAPWGGYLDAHALWHATTIPLTCLWWSFAKADAEHRTAVLVKKAK
ncbi:hypothetical protein HPP92_024248 [Vanilla planifolia]|uniref:Post-GPI attachment to proteins factor 3 n=1 Tax=Vanilla planifolia TaxID=51239 RepID=A0A835UCS1_VANPL|nr:hypothetical protein HPP92_024574 [Vanilla planifolia]KAG0456458.1 hypothetical protein HPP92_024246 [Vanilla planifolia]KAG0456460.1 hypothetical protein HPP92_024248 [Vanilla planifolia]